MKSIATNRKRRLSLLSAASLSVLGVYAGMSVAAPRTAPSNVSPPTIDGRAQEG
jgi:hypothetical protein